MDIFSSNKLRIASESSRRGFTLVEMIVALGIFSIVAVVALGALVKIISANKKAQTLQSSITNLNFALDSMSREMRVSSNYHCDGAPTYNYKGDDFDAPVPCNSSNIPIVSRAYDDVVIAFRTGKTATNVSTGEKCSLAFAYRFRPKSPYWSLQKATQQTCESAISSTDNSNPGNNDPNGFYDIIDPSVTITGYSLNVIATAYPKVAIRISGFAGVRQKERTYFDVETAISARIQ